MKKELIIAMTVLSLCSSADAQSNATRHELSLDNGWKFRRGIKVDAENPQLNDARWRDVSLPHDYQMEAVRPQIPGVNIGPFSRMSIGTADQGETIGGEGWYRRHLTLSDKDKDKRIVLCLDGIMMESMVYVNGQRAGFQPYGYTSYRVDISNLVKTGKDNVIAIRTVNDGLSSRWYAGSGIVRHVSLLITNKDYLDTWDTYLDGSDGKNVRFFTVVHGHADAVNVKITSPSGKVVADQQIAVSGDSVKAVFAVKKPELWSIETPRMYQAQVELVKNDQVIDAISQKFGMRTIHFSAKEGFLLNGKPVLMAGGCLHHDNGLLGAAAIDRAEVRKIELMKKYGYNAIRCSHNQESPKFFDACDSLGILVIHETFDQWERSKRDNDYSQYFKEWHAKDLSADIRRDRNHPSIIMWSIGNEIAQRATPEGIEIGHRLRAITKQLDGTRPATMAVNSTWDSAPYTWENENQRSFEYQDVAGYNYEPRRYEPDHEHFPDRIIYGSETYGSDFAYAWGLVKKHSYVIGDFVWTAQDYLGEAGLGHAVYLKPGERAMQLMPWPWFNSNCGDFDILGNQKPQGRYRDVVLGRRAIDIEVHEPMPEGVRESFGPWGQNWSWPNEDRNWNWQEGDVLSVSVYSQAKSVQLYLNDKLIGEQPTDERFHTTFQVPWQPGVLKAVAGKAHDEIETTGKPFRIILEADRNIISASHNDVAYIDVKIVDEEGRLVPNATNQLTIKGQGKYGLLTAGNADPTDMASFRSLTPKTFGGKAQIVLQPREGVTGEVEISVSAENLESAHTTVTIDNCSPATS